VLSREQRVELAVLEANVRLETTLEQNSSTLKILTDIANDTNATEVHFDSMASVLERASRKHIKHAIKKAKETYLKEILCVN